MFSNIFGYFMVPALAVGGVEGKAALESTTISVNIQNTHHRKLGLLIFVLHLFCLYGWALYRTGGGWPGVMPERAFCLVRLLLFVMRCSSAMGKFNRIWKLVIITNRFTAI